MIRRLLTPLCLFPLAACASTPGAPAPDVELDRFTYEVSVPSVPEGISELALSVEPPPESLLSISGLVGNAPFDVPVARSGAAAFSSDHVSVSFGTGFLGSGLLRITTPGKPIELTLRLGVPKGSPGAEQLEQTLVASTAAIGDGRPIEAVAKRFVRVR